MPSLVNVAATASRTASSLGSASRLAAMVRRKASRASSGGVEQQHELPIGEGERHAFQQFDDFAADSMHRREQMRVAHVSAACA